MKFPSLGALLSSLSPTEGVKGLPEILTVLLGGGRISENALKLFRQRASAQEARSAGKVLGFRAHKSISSVAQTLPAERRSEGVRAFARSIALQLVELAEELIQFAEVVLAREEARGDREREPEALARRELGEERVLQQGMDVGRIINGDAPLAAEEA